MSSVILGTNVETGEVVRIGDIERRSGLYLLGESGMGKSSLAVGGLAIHDIANGHGVFFLDPHGDAIRDLLRCGDYLTLQLLGTMFDIEDEDYSFGINLLQCENVASRKARRDTYTKAYNVFYKIWEEEFGPWLQLILQNVLRAFIENQGYTLADVPMFLNHENKEFRNHIIDNIQYEPAVADFWRYEFFQRRESEQQIRVEAALTRINTLLTDPDVRDIVGQQKTTLNFETLLTLPNILLFKLSANLPEDAKKFIGTILLNELVWAVRNRPEDERDQFCIFVDEFHNFASTDHMATLSTEGRKFGVATTYMHVERFGQLAGNQRLMGATAAIVNKVLFQTTVKDAKEFAPEFAKKVELTEKRTEPVLVFSTHPVEDIWDRSHPDEVVADMAKRYFWVVEALRRNQREELVVYNPTRIPRNFHFRHAGDMHFDYFDDWEYFAANTDMLRQGIAAFNTHYYYWMLPKSKTVGDEMLERALEIIECLGGVYGLRPSMEPYIDRSMRHALFQALNRHYGSIVQGVYKEVPPKYSPHTGKVIEGSYYVLDATYDPKKYRNSPDFPKILYDFADGKMLADIALGTYQGINDLTVDDMPSTIQQVGMLAGIRQLAAYIGMSPHEIENLISWRPRPLDAAEREFFTVFYKLNTREPLRSMWFDASARDQVWEITKDDWIKYYANREKMSQQVIDVNREHQYYIQKKMIERASWRIIETQYFFVSGYWQVSHVLACVPIKIQSGNYDESLRVERPQHDMVTDMELELSTLPRYQAYVKIIQETNGKQTVATHKIETKELPPPRESDIETLVRVAGYDFCKKRDEIEAEIRERQKRWLPGSDKPTTRGR